MCTLRVAPNFITGMWFVWCFTHTQTQNNPKSQWLACDKGPWRSFLTSSKEEGNTSPVLLQFLIFSSHNTELSSSLLISRTRGHKGQELAAMIKYINTDVKNLSHGPLSLCRDTSWDSSPMHSVSLLQSLLQQKEVRSCLKGSHVVQNHVWKFYLVFG